MMFAKFLAGSGCKSCFIGQADNMNMIREAGFDYYMISPFLLIPEGVQIKENGLLKFLLDTLDRSRFKRAKTDFEDRSRSYERMIESIQPDIILLDDHYAYKVLYYQKYGIPVITIQTMILPLKSKGIPPFQSTYMPGEGRVSGIYTELLWIINRITRSFARFRNRLRTLGETDLSILRKLCSAFGLRFDYNRCFGVGISGLPIISTTPKPLDYPRIEEGHSGIYYYGNQESTSDQNIEDGRLLKVLSKVEQEKKADPDKALIYCSLGTVMNRGEKTRQTFYTKIISVALQNPHIEFVLSIGKDFDVNSLSGIPQNLNLFSWVPQKALLAYVDLMITHGGINSVKECIEAGVPTLNYPLTDKWDQPGTAARVVYHDLGLMGNIRWATPRSISGKIKTILRERERFGRSIQDMKRKIDESNRAEEKRILELIETLSRVKENPKRESHEIHE